MSTPEEREAERVAAAERHFLRRKPSELRIVPTQSLGSIVFGRTAAELVLMGVLTPDGAPEGSLGA